MSKLNLTTRKRSDLNSGMSGDDVSARYQVLGVKIKKRISRFD